MKTIVLLSCVSKKRSTASPARELYESHLFRKAYAYACALQPHHIYILSAKHGLLDPEDVIEPYDLTLNSLSATEVRAWADRVRSALAEHVDLSADRFIFLAGERYRKYLLPHITYSEIPMRGLTIGKQLQFLKAQVAHV